VRLTSHVFRLPYEVCEAKRSFLAVLRKNAKGFIP
jgi:hypothetical protein